MPNEFGKLFGDLRRRNTGLSLREFCQEHGLDPSNISKMERGLLPPPSSAKLNEYARALKVEEWSDEWFELSNKAAMARREVPPYVHLEGKLLELLPLLFREARENNGLSDERMQAMIDFLRRT